MLVSNSTHYCVLPWNVQEISYRPSLILSIFKFFQFAFGVPELHLKDIACSTTLLEQFLVFPSRQGPYAVRNAMCVLTPQQLQIIEDKFYANIDFFKLPRLVSVGLSPDLEAL